MPKEPGIVERALERSIFQSRWLMAPFYIGLIICLFVLLVTFLRELATFASSILVARESDVILGALALVDLSLTGNLLLIVIFSGYENFVSRIDPEGYPDWPEWITKIDFGGLKQKLIASIIAISAIQVLKAFMNLDKHLDDRSLAWLVGIHIVFVFSGLMLALTEWFSADLVSKAEEDKSKFKKK